MKKEPRRMSKAPKLQRSITVGDFQAFQERFTYNFRLFKIKLKIKTEMMQSNQGPHLEDVPELKTNNNSKSSFLSKVTSFFKFN